MDLQTLLLNGRDRWDGNSPAAAEDVAALVSWCPVELPSEYLELLRSSDGGDAQLSGYPNYVRIWSARSAIEQNQAYEIQSWLPGFIGIGDNGGSELVGFDTRGGEPYRVCTMPSMPMAWDDALGDALDFPTFIRRLSIEPE
jgi:hypothetical protein